MKRILGKALAVVTLGQLFIFSSLEPCTRVFWNDNGQAKIVARTMDLFISDEPQLWINPRGIVRHSKVDSHGLKWTSRYGSVSISAFQMKDLLTDGLNEQGLAVHALALGATKYEKRDSRPGVHYGEWLQYLLDTCKTVKEAVKAHDNFQVVPIAVKEFVWPLHLMIEDASGDSAIIEFVGGERKIYHGSPYQVTTNDPPYDIQLQNLKKYEGLGGDLPLPSFTKADSSSRFVLASAHLKQLPKPKSTDEAVASAKNLISQLFQKGNVSKNTGVSFMGPELSVSTLWTVVVDLTHRTYHFFRTGDEQGTHLNLSELNFAEGAPTKVLNLFDPSFSGRL